MSKILTRNYRARFSDINANGWMTPAGYARYVIETAYDWGENLGLGEKVAEELGIYWVVRETEILFIDRLHFLDEFDLTIWMLEWKRVRGTRAFIVRNQTNRKVIAQGVQQIACLDRSTQRPTSPPEDLIENFRLDSPTQIPSQRFPKLLDRPESTLNLQIQVSWQDLDSFDMVNNAVYIAYAEEAAVRSFAAFGWAPSELKNQRMAWSLRRMHIRYHLPAGWGDRLDLAVACLNLESAGGSLGVVMTRSSDGVSIADCMLDWELVDSAGRKACPLPESLSRGLSGLLIP